MLRSYSTIEKHQDNQRRSIFYQFFNEIATLHFCESREQHVDEEVPQDGA